MVRYIAGRSALSVKYKLKKSPKCAALFCRSANVEKSLLLGLKDHNINGKQSLAYASDDVFKM